LRLATHIVPADVTKERLSDYLCGIFPQLPSRKSVKKAIKRGQVMVDNEQGTTGRWVYPQMKIELYELDAPPPRIFELSLEVLFEDVHIAVIHKPAGYPVSGNQFRTIENALLYNIRPSSELDALRCPRVAHRLDAPTAGVLLVAKTKTARMLLGQQFEARHIQKTYMALIIGDLSPKKGTINTPIDHKEAVTHYQIKRSVPSLKNGTLSEVALYPKTGRTHQLRRHLSGIGHPILGDKQYGKEGLILKNKGLFLFAQSLQFTHPHYQKKQLVTAPRPNKFNRRMNNEERRWYKYNEK